jgi:hypothetical protein
MSRAKTAILGFGGPDSEAYRDTFGVQLSIELLLCIRLAKEICFITI